MAHLYSRQSATALADKNILLLNSMLPGLLTRGWQIKH